MTRSLRFRFLGPVVTLLLSGSLAFPQNVRVGVLGLFRPVEFTLCPSGGDAVVLHAGPTTFVLENSSGANSAHIRLSEGAIVVQVGAQTVRAADLRISSRQNSPADFTLAIPEKITRRYRGILEIEPNSGILLAIVSMDLETAVASVVAAESATDTPPEALKAQAIAARSYFIGARERHRDFDFCDSTHCQFLRNPPAAGMPAAQAAADTRGMVLAYRSETVAAMYTRSCGGRTRTPSEVGLPSGPYPYYSVDCKYCREHPVRWKREVSAQDAARLADNSEAERLKIDRRLGWATVPSNSFSMQSTAHKVVLEGSGEGHGIGLCQAGARAMANEGATFAQILAHYYPNTNIVRLDGMTAAVR